MAAAELSRRSNSIFLSLQKFFDIPIRIDNTSCCSKTDDFGNRCCFVGRDCTTSCDVSEFETAWLVIEGALIRVSACDSLMSHDWSSQFSRIPSILGFFLMSKQKGFENSRLPDPVLQFALTAGSVSLCESTDRTSSPFADGSHHASRCQEENPEREPQRVLPVKVVRFGEAAPVSQEGSLQSSTSCTSTGGEECHGQGCSMLSSKGVHCGGSQPIRPMVQVHQVSEETLVSTLRTGRSTTTGEEEECDSSNLCGGSKGSSRCPTQERIFDSSIIVGNDSRGSSGDSGSTVSHNDGGRGRIYDSGSSTIGAVHVPHHAESSHDADSATTGVSSKGSFEPPGSHESGIHEWRDRGGRGRGHDLLGPAASLLSKSSTMSLASLGKLGTEFCTDLDLSHWFISPLHAFFSARLSKSNSHVFTWTSLDTGSCFAVWFDKRLSDDLVFSDMQDDWEFHVTKGTKKKLNTALTFLANSKDGLTSFHSDCVEIRGMKGPAEETSGLQESTRGMRGPTEETSELQEISRGRGPTVETSGLQENTRGGEAQLLSRELTATPTSNATSPPHGLPVDGLNLLGSAMVSQVDVSNQPYCMCELFSPPRVTLRASKLALRTTNPPAFDLEVGWDFFRPDHRAMFWETIQEQKPDMILMSPDCGPFSILMNVNWDKMDEREKKTLQTRALTMLHFCIQVAEYQLAHNGCCNSRE